MTDEIWKDIKGYEGLYQISSFGRVRSVDRMVWGGNDFYLKKGEIKKLQINTGGYWVTMLYKNNNFKTVRIHREVAKSFIDNPLNKPFVNHIDSNRLNSNVENLEWCTQKENMLHASSSGSFNGRVNLKARHHEDVKLLTMATYLPFKKQSEIFLMFKINKTLIPDIKRGHCYLSFKEIFKTIKDDYESNRAGHIGMVKA